MAMINPKRKFPKKTAGKKFNAVCPRHGKVDQDTLIFHHGGAIACFNCIRSLWMTKKKPR